MKRPKINPPITTFDIIIEGLAAICLLYMLVQIAWEFGDLSRQVPTHFDASGKADALGSKNTLLLLPLVAIILYIGLTVLNRFPNIFNFPVSISETNAAKQYQLAKSLISFLKFATIAMFMYIQVKTIGAANGQGDGLGTFFIVAVMTGSFVPIIVYFVLASKNK